MLIDSLSIHYSGKVQSAQIDGPTQFVFIESFRQLLVSVGWTVIQPLFATGQFILPIGAPITDGVSVLPHRLVGCPGYPGFISIGNVSYNFYDPFKEDVQPGSACGFAAMDTTVAGSLANLATVIGAGGAFSATFSTLGSGWQITLTAQQSGPISNLDVLNGNGSYVESGANFTGGGGYILQSSSGSNSTVYQVSLTGEYGGGTAGNILFKFNLNGGTISYQILDAIQGTQGDLGALGVGAVASYTVLANPYGFAVFDAAFDSGRPFRTISLFAMAPYIPSLEVPAAEGFRVPGAAVFVVGPNNVAVVPSWYQTSACVLDTAPFTAVANNPWPRLLVLRNPGTTGLLTPAGVPIYVGAYCMFGGNSADGAPAYVIGKLWDCAIMHSIQSDAIIQQQAFTAVGGSVGANGETRCTLMMATGKQINPPPVGNTPPPPPPAHKSGVVNIFGDNVIWISGDTFNSGQVGEYIIVGGVGFTIKTFIDSHNIVVSSALIVANAVGYVIP